MLDMLALNLRRVTTLPSSSHYGLSLPAQNQQGTSLSRNTYLLSPFFTLLEHPPSTQCCVGAGDTMVNETNRGPHLVDCSAEDTFIK